MLFLKLRWDRQVKCVSKSRSFEKIATFSEIAATFSDGTERKGTYSMLGVLLGNVVIINHMYFYLLEC